MTLQLLLANSPTLPRIPARQRIGSYDLHETLGRGNFGKVRRATHVTTGRHYAIKIVETSLLKQDLPGNLDIRREMSILRAMTHPHIVFLYEVMVSPSRVFMVMDLARGGDFFQLIRSRGRLSDELARKFFRQLVSAVAYCHANGVYHRDLKPENMLVTDSGDLKVTDFGFSAMKDHTGMMLRTNCGSPHYCAPEVWNGTQYGYDGEKADAFSVGVILYVLLVGAQPFNDDDEGVLLRKVDQCRVVYPKHVCDDARDLLGRLLVRDPKKRWDLTMVQRHSWFMAASVEPLVREMGAADDGARECGRCCRGCVGCGGVVRARSLVASRPRWFANLPVV